MAWLSSPVSFSVQTQFGRRYMLRLARDWSLSLPRKHLCSPRLLHFGSSLTLTKTRNRSRHRYLNMTTPSRPLNNSADPVERTSSPYPVGQIGPKSQLLAARTGNYHSTSLRLPSMVTVNTVNKTALHPGEYYPYPYRLLYTC